MSQGKNALMVLRGQPMHYGHIHGIKMAEKEGVSKILLGIGSSNEKHSLKDPFTWQEREKMFHLGLEGELNIPFETFPVPNLGSNELWAKNIYETAPDKFDIVYTGNHEVSICFPNEEIREIDESHVHISATTVRQKIIEGADLSEYVPKKIEDYLEEINARERLIQMRPRPLNPELAADAIIEYPLDNQVQGKLFEDHYNPEQEGIVLIHRKNAPIGWALPGGFVDNGESAETAAIREAKEETDLDFTITKQLHFYSDPKGDPRRHIATVVYWGKGQGVPEAGDDADDIMVVDALEASKMKLAMPRHNQIISDYVAAKK